MMPRIIRRFVFTGAGEEIFQSFLGVPIVHQREILGVLVVQQTTQR